MKIKLYILIICFGLPFLSYSQNYKTYTSGNNDCLTIKIPSTWKIYDDDWNAYISNLVNPNTQKVTIIRASDYDNSTFYFKVSYIDMGVKYSKEDIISDDFDFLNSYDIGLMELVKQLNNTGNTVLSYNKSKFVAIDKAYGAYYSYTYTNTRKETRTSEIYCVIIGQTAYYVTISWDIYNSSSPEIIKTNLISNLKLCDLLN